MQVNPSKMASIISKMGGKGGGFCRKFLLVFLGGLVFRTIAKAIFGPERDVTKVTIFGGGFVLVALQVWQSYIDGKIPSTVRQNADILPGASAQSVGRYGETSSSQQETSESFDRKLNFSKSARGKENASRRLALISGDSNERWDYEPALRRQHKASRRLQNLPERGNRGNVGSNGLYLGRSKHQVDRLRNRLNKKPKRRTSTSPQGDEDIPDHSFTGSTVEEDKSEEANQLDTIGSLEELLESIGQKQLLETFEEEELTNLQLLCRMKSRDTYGFERKLERLGMKKIGQREMFIQSLCDWEANHST